MISEFSIVADHGAFLLAGKGCVLARRVAVDAGRRPLSICAPSSPLQGSADRIAAPRRADDYFCDAGTVKQL